MLNYPFITQRSLAVAVGAASALVLTNPAGGAVVWTSGNVATATVNAAGNVTGVARGNTTINVRNANGDTDQIPVTVN